ncbi:MAG: porin family protein [Bacteroidales bacterium]|nr:porin family protein [Bacteroidales bacterium]
MKKGLIYFIFGIFHFSIYGQGAYFLTDSISSTGENIIDNGDLLNAQFCTVEEGKKSIRYTPYQVKEYGLNDGRIFFSKTIQIGDSLRKVFLLQLVKGKISLYYYRGKSTKTFFWEKDSTTLHELPKRHKNFSKKGFRDDLADLMNDCDNVKDATTVVNYNSKSLTELITYYNSCTKKPLQHFRYGFLLGAGLNRLEVAAFHINSAANLKFSYEAEFSPGIFIDFPIEMSNFSFHTDLYFTKTGYYFNSIYTDVNFATKNTTFVANTTSIYIPVLLRYTLPTISFRPFFNTGLIYAYNIKNNTDIYTSTIYPSHIESSIVDNSLLITKSQIGYSAGAGIEYKLSNEHSVFIDLRYNKLFSLPNNYNLNKSSVQLIVAVNL